MNQDKINGPYERWEDIPAEVLREFEMAGYRSMRFIPGQGLCALQFELFTVALLYGIGRIDFQGKYTFSDYREARLAIDTWSGEGLPGAHWINHYGQTGGRVRNLEHPINKGHIFNDD